MVWYSESVRLEGNGRGKIIKNANGAIVGL
jgi:hypothetical protein